MAGRAQMALLRRPPEHLLADEEGEDEDELDDDLSEGDDDFDEDHDFRLQG